MDNEKTLKNELSTKEIVLSVLKAGASSFPVAASLASMFSDYQSHKQ